MPWFTEICVGCFFWGWAIYCDMQVYLLIPIYVVIYKKLKTTGAVVFSILLITLNICFSMYICWLYKYTVGPGTAETYTFWSYLANKPHTKLYAQAIGVLVCLLYFEILEYRKVKDENERKNLYPKIDYLHKNFWLSFIA